MSRAGSARCAAAILVYHSVADVEHDPFGITVAPDHFRGHMEVLARRFTPLSLEQLCDGLDRGELPERSVVVTFDDGYANNLSAALPSLAAAGVPASLFVATGYVGSEREFWWDEVQRLVGDGAGADRPPVLELTVTGQTLRCPMGDGATAAKQIALWLQGRPAGSVEEALAQLHQWAGIGGNLAPRETHRPLTLDELRELAGSDRLEIGAHTRHHLRLGAQTAGVQHDEIAGSRADLERWLGAAPAAFAYPFGNPGSDYSPATVAAVAEIGFARAVSGGPGLTGRSSPRYELPRWFVTTPAPADFERWLANRFRPAALRAVGKLTRMARRAGR
jgi:peptidoglycan/xylan/chitin deacetylase (PgdA/CDA1 family)